MYIYLKICEKEYSVIMYQKTLFFFPKIFLILNNHLHQSKSKIPWIVSKENEQFASTRDINIPLANISSMPSLEFSNPRTQNITMRGEYLISQNLFKGNIIHRKYIKRVGNFSKGNRIQY